MAHYQQKHSVEPDRSFNHVRNIISKRLSRTFINIIVEILHFLFAEFLVTLQVKIGARMNAFYFFETNRKLKFNIAGCISVMRQFDMVMKPIFFFRNSKSKM